MSLGTFIVYILEWALALLIFLALYKLCLSGSTLHRFNRYYLLGSVALSMILPLFHISSPDAQQFTIEQTTLVKALRHNPESTFMLPDIEVTASGTNPGSQSDTIWALLIIAIYTIYVVTLLIGWTRSSVKIIQFLRGKPQHRLGRWIHIVTHDEAYGPFNWINYIVVPSSESGFSRRASILHELSHVKQLHFLDLLFLLVCTVLNPVCWLVMKEIKIVHEYEADDEVINHYHVVSRDYQRLLLIRTVGAEAYALASSFNLNIKKRIIMMKKQKSTKWRTLWLLAAIPIMGIALTAFARPISLEGVKKEIKTNVVANIINEQPTTPSTITKSLPLEEDLEEVPEAPIVTDDEPLVVLNGNVVNVKGAKIIKEGGVALNISQNVFESLGLKEDDIESVSILKDAAAKAIWGEQGKNGVIEIRTKKHAEEMRQEIRKLEAELSTAQEDLPIVQEQADGQPSDDDEVFQVVEEMPEFTGGMPALMAFLSKNIHYPQLAKELGVQGRVIVKFVVNKVGGIEEVKVVKSAIDIKTNHPDAESEKAKGLTDEQIKVLQARYDQACTELDNEAERVIKSMPAWTPGKQRGKTVRVLYNVPINFRLN